MPLQPSTYVIPTCDCYSALYGAPFFYVILHYAYDYFLSCPPSLQINFSPETRQIKQNKFGAGVIVIGVINLSFTVLAIMTVDKFEELWEPAAEKTQPASAQ
ncbi:hypothetical protein [Citrobacter braakii]|uniref:hypothetical protein n=1 Tax=Citrobacter braakii TaxID=57706 RepID=UPI0024333B55|nr:hypothetical protein [Citrobacter braakii]WFW17332.1 hypothetical protein NFJ61_21520 [Citrobacter braakii]